MILTLNQIFEGYTPIEILSNDRITWREEYKATNRNGKLARLIVFDYNSMPEPIRKREMSEFDIYDKLSSEAFPKLIECDRDSKSIGWIALEYSAHSMPLDKWIEAYGTFDERTASDIICTLAQGLDQLRFITRGGGHYNLCPANIEVEYTHDKADGKPEYSGVRIYGLTFADMPIEGNPTFNAKDLNPLYRASETRFGKYSSIADIFSLGVLMAYMIKGEYPWQYDESDPFSAIDSKRTFPLKIEGISRRIFVAINRCIMRNANGRTKSYSDLISLIKDGTAEHTGVSTATSRKVKLQIDQEKNKRSNVSEEKCIDNNVTIEPAPQPKCNVEFTELSGNGFGDVAGMEEVKKKFRRNFIDIVNYKEMAKEYDITPPSLTLLAGPQGCGKTFLTKKLAEECNLYFSYISPSQLGNIYIHGSQHMIADLFKKAEEKAKVSNRGVLLMIDEFDALAPTRTNDSNNGHNDEVNELLAQINECSSRGIYIIAATNRPDIIDTAITRSGRMDDFIYIGLPDKQTRIEMFELGLKKRPHEQDMDLNRLGDLTDGYTNSDIDAIIREAGRAAFDQSISRGDGTLVKITQQLIEDTISSCRPSVSTDEIKEYERMRDKFLRRDQKLRRRVGF